MSEQKIGGSAISGQFLADVRTAYLKWFGKGYDLQVLEAVLAAAAAEQLGGDPPWLLVVGGSGAAKTETIMPLQGVNDDRAIVTSTITGEAALLSGTPESERTKGATGGLLRKMGDGGILVIKDVTSILSMSRDARASVLAALREIYDGRWEREIGAEGGKTLSWKGRIVVIGGVTTAWDSAHSVISMMGDRFVLVRFNSKENRREAGRQALRNVGKEDTMRAELKAAVERLLDQAKDAEVELTDDDSDRILDLANLVTLARTAVERDFSGNVVQAHDPESPTRFTKQLAQIFRGGLAIGMNHDDAMDTACRCAGDTMPPLRLQILADVAEHPKTATKDVTKRTQVPRKTADRALQELHLLGLLEVEYEEYGDGKVRWLYSVAEPDDVEVIRKLARNGNPPTTCTVCGGPMKVYMDGQTTHPSCEPS